MASVYRSARGQREIRDWCLQRIDAWDVVSERWQILTCAGLTSALIAGPRPSRDTPTVVLVPGTNMSAAVCLASAGELAARWPTVVLDIPGQPGLSGDERPRRGRNWWYGQWLAEAIEQTVPGPAVAVGHSLGGAAILACPSLQIAGQVLISPAGLSRLVASPPVVATTVAWLARPTLHRSTNLLGHMVGPDSPVPTGLAEWMTVVARFCHSTLTPGPLPSAMLDRRRARASVVAAGSDDILLPPARLGPATRRHLGSDLRVFGGRGHLLFEEAPKEIATLVGEVYAVA